MEKSGRAAGCHHENSECNYRIDEATHYGTLLDRLRDRQNDNLVGRIMEIYSEMKVGMGMNVK